MVIVGLFILAVVFLFYNLFVLTGISLPPRFNVNMKVVAVIAIIHFAICILLTKEKLDFSRLKFGKNRT